MPLYEYECQKCGRRNERIETFKGPHLRKCPSCGGKVEQLISAPALQFKGTGWYVTDYAGKSATGEPARGDGNEPAPKAADGKEAGGGKESKDSKDAKESKPANESKETKKSKPESKSSKEK